MTILSLQSSSLSSKHRVGFERLQPDYKMRNQIILVTLIALCVSVYSGEDCGSKLGELIKMTLTGCPDLEQRCVLHRNSNVTLSMEFKTKANIEKVKSVVYGVVLGVPIPFALPNPDGCNESGLTCPLENDKTYTYVATLPVEKKYPKVTVDVKWELQNEKEENVLCLLIPSKIQ